LALQQALREASDHQGPWPRIAIWHGSADQTVVPSNAQSIAAQWRAVHNLDELPTFSDTTGSLERQVWCDVAGDAVIELNMIAGMAHGTPIGDGLGAAGPFMIDVGISSTGASAQFWGIADTTRDKSLEKKRSTGNGARPPSPSGMPALQTPAAKSNKPSRPPLAAQHSETAETHGVRKIIEDALRAAGLMR
jgi:hypothetical protein